MTTDSHMTTCKSRSGLTLVEAVLAMVILGMAAAGVLLPFARGASVQAEGLHRTLAATLADGLMERIVNTPFDEIVSTWDAHSEAEGQLRDASDTTFTDSMYARYSRGAECDEVYVPQQGGAAAPNFILATVRVYYRGEAIATINRLISE